MELTFHLVPKAYFLMQSAYADYVPAHWAQEGFIHCTDDPEEMARVANRLYRSEPPPHLYLYIDKAKVHAPIRYDEAGRKYPHIYGPLNRDAIIDIREAQRDGTGNFLPPEPLDLRRWLNG